MRSYGVPAIHDLVSDGGSTVALTPGAAPVKAEFLASAPKAGVGDNWPLAMNAIARVRVTVDQPGSGGTAIPWDCLAAIADSFDVSSPVFGNSHPRDTFTGPITKHIAEFVSSGYNYADGGRTQIAAADGDTVIDVYFVLPYAHECFERPHHFAPWLGWLQNTEYTFYLAASTVLAAVSTGAVLKATANVQMWIEYVVSDELLIPTWNQFHLYEAAAAGGTTAIFQGLGTENGLSDVLTGSRIAGLFELTNVTPAGSLNLMGGPTSAENFTSVAFPQFLMDGTDNVDAFFAAYRRVIGGHRGPIANAAGSAAHDRGGNPNAQQASEPGNTYGNLASAYGALYMPWKAPGRDAMLTKMPKFVGDLKRVAKFTSTPSGGRYRLVANEMRELGPGKVKELIGKTGRAGTTEPIWNGGSKGTADNARHPRRQAGLPQRVVFT